MSEPTFQNEGQRGLWRLTKLADLLDTVDEEHEKKNEPKYRQRKWSHPCGTPACALGHWAAAHQDRWILRRVHEEEVLKAAGLNPWDHREWAPRLSSVNSDAAFRSAMKEFHLTYEEAAELFDGNGCDGAQTAEQAAAYIRAFVRRKHDGAG